MKKLFSVLIAVSMLLCESISFAAVNVGDIPANPRAVPASVYETPFPADRFTTQYAPWLRNLHLMNENEYNSGRYAGEACQQIKVMEVSSVNPDIMYFGTDTSGIFKSTDGGKHWYNTSGNMPSYFAQGIMCDRLNENTVYVAMVKDGVYRSKDGGRNWQLIVRDRCKRNDLGPDKISQDKQGNTYIAASNGIYRLERGKDIPVNLYPEYASLDSNTGNVAGDIRVSDDGMIIAASYQTKNDVAKPGLHLSRDGGKTWDIVNIGAEDEYTVAYSVEMHPENPNEIYLSATTKKSSDNTTSDNGLFVSRDCGKTWEKLFELFYENKEENVAKTRKTLCMLEFGPKNADGIYPLYGAGWAVQYPLRVSYDYGKSFSPIHARLGQGTFRHRAGGEGETGWFAQGFALDMQNPGKLIFACAGIYSYDNGKIEWMGSGFSGLSLTCINMDKNGRMILSATDVGTIVSNTNYQKGQYPFFTMTDAQIITDTVTDPNDPNHIIAYNGNSNSTKKELGIVESFDGAYTFSQIKEDTVNTTGDVYVLEYDKDDKNTIYASNFTSRDNGKTWTPNEYFLLDISDQNPDKMLARKTENKVTKLYLSYDRGKTWEYFMDGRSDYVNIRFDMADDNYIWYSQLQRFGRFNIEKAANESYASKFPYPTFDYFAQNPKNPKHIVMSLRGWLDYGDLNYKNEQIVETIDGGETWHVVPGVWPSYYQKIFFSEVSDEVFFTGHAGTFIYDYKKYWEFLDSKITVQFDGEEISFSVMPEIKEGRTMVPMRELFEMLGATVEWDGETRTVTANKGRSSVKLQIDNLAVNMNGEEKLMEAAPYIVNGRTMVPLRFASEALGIRVGWDNANRLIVMKSE